MYKLLLFILYCGINNAQISKKVQDYYKSESYLKFKELWQPQRKSFESIIAQNLEKFIEINRQSIPLSDGVYIDDNVLKVLLYNVRLRQFPRLLFPEVTMALASNELSVTARLSKMIAPADYILFGSRVEPKGQDPYNTSPFTFPQVMHSGTVAIIAEHCSLSGHVITKVDGMSVNLGQNTFQVSNCQFTIEITVSNSGAPPIIAPYFGPKNSQRIHGLLSNPIRQKLMDVLQLYMYTYINTSAIFGTDLPKIRKGQDDIFLVTTNYTRGLVKKAVSNTVEKNLAVQPLESLSVYCNMNHQHRDVIVYVNISKVGVYELDKLYSAHIGGPHMLSVMKIGENFRFGTLMIRGRLSTTISNITKTYDFLAEISDVYVSFELNIENRTQHTLDFIGWRFIDVSIKSDIYDEYRDIGRSMLTGYIGHRLTNLLNLHLSNVFDLLDSDNEGSFEMSETEQNGTPNKHVLNTNLQSNTSQSSKETNEIQKDNDSTKYDSDVSQIEQDKFHLNITLHNDSVQNSTESNDGLNDIDNTQHDSDVSQTETFGSSNKDDQQDTAQDHSVQSNNETNEAFNEADNIEHDSGASQIEEDKSSNKDDLHDTPPSRDPGSGQESKEILKNEDNSSKNELNVTPQALETGEEKNESQNGEDNSQENSDEPRVKLEIFLDNKDATDSEND